MSEPEVLKEIKKLCSEYGVQIGRSGGRGKIDVTEVRLMIKSISMIATGGIAMAERGEKDENNR